MPVDEPPSSLARRHKVGIASIYRWLDKYEEAFIATLTASINEEPKQMDRRTEPETEKIENTLKKMASCKF